MVMCYNRKRVLTFLEAEREIFIFKCVKHELELGICRQMRRKIGMWVSRWIKIFPRKTIQIGKTAEEIEGLSEQYFKELPNEGTDQLSGEDCEYPILEREILPEKILCPKCGHITLEGLDYCDKCGADLNAERIISRFKCVEH